jgi:hypothetical protein
MKKIIFISLAFAFLKANTQTYQYVPFPTENAVWSEEYWFSSENKYSIHSYERFAINGEDTLINNKVYKKLYLFYDTIFNSNTAIYLGGIREENKKIYYLGDTVHQGKPLTDYYGFNQEILLYDFSLNIGDTLPTVATTPCNFIISPTFVTEIDTVLIGNKFRKVFKFNTYGVSWAEGIGNISIFGDAGLLFCIAPHPTKGDWGNHLICFKQNDTIIYFNNNYSECMPLNINENNVMNENIVVSPNPATNYLTIKSGIIQPFTFQLYNMQGTALLAGKTSNTQTELNVANLPRGLYVLKIITNNQSVAKKIVLQ